MPSPTGAAPSPVDGETARAFGLFAVLLIGLLAIGGELAFRQSSLEVLGDRLDVGRRAAASIARRAIAALEAGEGARAYPAIGRTLDRVISREIERIPAIRTVEVCDRWGVRVALVGRTAGGSSPAPAGRIPASWPALDRKMLREPLGPGGRGGEVLVGISQDAIVDELVALRRSLRTKTAVAGLAALGLLVLAFFYVLHLIRKNRRLDRERQAAERASYVGLLASGLAHEIRNPLNAMNMNLQMLEEDLQTRGQLDDPDDAEMLDSTKREIERLEQLVTNFLTYARPTRPSLRPGDPNDVVDEVARFLAAEFEAAGVGLETRLERPLPAIELDPTQLRQALMNLLVNARQVLGDGGRVEVRTAAERGGVRIEIEDDGPGIDEEARERVFQEFFSRRGGGTGLGLPIARQIVERHGGSLELESEVGRGTVFTIRLPRPAQRAAS